MKVKRAGLDPDDYSKVYELDEVRRLLAAPVSGPESKTTVEVISGGPEPKPTKMYLDCDLKFPEDPGDDVRRACEATIRGKAQAVVEAIRSTVPHLCNVDDEEELDRALGEISYVMAARHGELPGSAGFKLSFRVFVKGVVVNAASNVPKMIATFRKCGFLCDEDLTIELGQGSGSGTPGGLGPQEVWDMAPYKASDQLLAAVNCRKSAEDPRVLRPLDGGDVLDYVAQHYEPHWVFMNFREPPEETRETLESQGTPSTMLHSSECDRELVDELLSCLDESYADRRDLWIAVGLALKKASEVAGDVDAFFDAWVAFSRRCPSKFCALECRRTWDSFRSSSSTRRLTIASLVHWARTCDPERCRRSIQAFRRRRSEHDRAPSEVGRDQTPWDAIVASIRDNLLRRWPERFQGRLSTSSFSIVKSGSSTLAFKDLDVSGKIYQDFSVWLDAAGRDGEDLLLGLLSPGLTLKELSHLHKDLDYRSAFAYSRAADANVALLTGLGNDDNKCIKIFDPYSSAPNAKVTINGRPTELTAKKLNWLMDKIATGAEKHAISLIGPDAGSWFTLINNGTINIYNGEGDRKRLNHDALAIMVGEANSELVRRMKYVPDVKSTICQGVYYCDPKTNVWAQEHNGFFEELIRTTIKGLPEGSLSDQDMRNALNRRGAADILDVFANKYCRDKSLLDKLDANLDVFAVDNGVFDMTTGAFRPIRPDDYVMTTAGWSYDAEAAVQFRPDVEAFLERLLPLPDERRVVLSFFGRLMSGRRIEKKFMIFTDERAGNNGKSTMAGLLMRFFGRFKIKSTKFVSKATFSGDKDSHDAGLEAAIGKRLIVADELKKSMVLDEGFFKDAMGGPDNPMEGRRFGRSERFTYVWQAGLLLIFNEGDCPKFDAADIAFQNRMIVAPFRSKFLPPETYAARAEQGDLEPYTFVMDYTITQKYNKWLPALADILLEHSRLQLFHNLPPDMAQWRHGVSIDHNPYAGWLQDHLKVTGNTKDDFVLLSDLKFMHGGGKGFVMGAKAYLSTLPGAVCFDTTKVRVNGEWKTKRDVVKGVRVKTCEDDEGEEGAEGGI